AQPWSSHSSSGRDKFSAGTDVGSSFQRRMLAGLSGLSGKGYRLAGGSGSLITTLSPGWRADSDEDGCSSSGHGILEPRSTGARSGWLRYEPSIRPPTTAPARVILQLTFIGSEPHSLGWGWLASSTIFRRHATTGIRPCSNQ